MIEPLLGRSFEADSVPGRELVAGSKLHLSVDPERADDRDVRALFAQMAPSGAGDSPSAGIHCHLDAWTAANHLRGPATVVDGVLQEFLAMQTEIGVFDEPLRAQEQWFFGILSESRVMIVPTPEGCALCVGDVSIEFT